MVRDRKVFLKLILILFLITVLLSTLYIGYYLVRDAYNHVYVIDIDRTSTDKNGTGMIFTAEGIDYSALFNISPRGPGQSLLFKPTEDGANFISTENIDNYSARVEGRKDDHTFGHYKLKYKAMSMSFKDIELRLISRNFNEGNGTGLYVGNRTIKIQGAGLGVHTAYFNGSVLSVIDAFDSYYWDESLNITYHDCHFIEMTMEYSTKPKPDEGGGFFLKQYVVLDEEGALMFVHLYRYDTGVLDDRILAD